MLGIALSHERHEVNSSTPSSAVVSTPVNSAAVSTHVGAVVRCKTASQKHECPLLPDGLVRAPDE